MTPLPWLDYNGVLVHRVPKDLILSVTENKIYCKDEWWISVIDCATNRVVREIPHCSYWEDVLLGYGGLWNARHNRAYLHSWGGIDVIDCRTDRLLTTIRSLPFTFMDMVYDDSMDCLVVCDSWSRGWGYAVNVYDGQTCMLIDRVLIKKIPAHIVWGPAEHRYYVLGLGDSCWLNIIDARTRPLVSERFNLGISAEQYYTGMMYLERYRKLYIGVGPTILVWDCGGDSVIQRLDFPGHRFIYNSAVDKIYTLGRYGDSIVVINARSDSIIGWVKLPGKVLRTNKDAVAVPQLNRLYVYTDSGVAVVDCQHDSLISLLRVEWSLVDACRNVIYNPNNNRIYVGARHRVYVFDASTNLLVDSIRGGIEIHNLCWNKTMRKLYVFGNVYGSGIGLCSVLDESGNLLKTFPVGGNVEEINITAVNKQGSKIYVVSWDDTMVKVIDCLTDTVIKEIRVAPEPWMLSISTKDQYLYLSHFSSPGRLTVIDTDTDSVVQEVELDFPSYGCYWHAGVKKGYFDQPLPGAISVYDCVLRRVTGIIQTPYSVWYMYCDTVFNRVYATTFGDPLFSIDAVADTVLRLFPDLRAYSWLTGCNNKVYYGARTLPPQGLEQVLGVVDCERDSLVSVIYHGASNSHWITPGILGNRLIVPLDPKVYEEGTVDSFGLAVVDCVNDRIADYIQFPITAKWANWWVQVDEVNSRVFASSGSRVYVLQLPVPGFQEEHVRTVNGLKVNPSPVAGGCVIQGQGPAVPLLIYDRSGRYLRTVEPVSRTDCAEWHWDGRDGKGQPVPAGIYFLRPANGTSRIRVVKVR
jgi:YVTN family beta-propeller protein